MPKKRTTPEQVSEIDSEMEAYRKEPDGGFNEALRNYKRAYREGRLTHLIPYRPGRGDNITVEPIRSERAINRIYKELEHQPRNHLLFTMGINSGLRVGDLLRLKVWQVMNCTEGDYVDIRESKTGKPNVLAINNNTCQSLKRFLEVTQPKPSHPLFKSLKSNKPLTTAAVNSLIKKWTTAAGLKGRYGCHSLRKTWGYNLRMKYGVSFEIIRKHYNHSNPAVTMRYLGITDRQVADVLLLNVGKYRLSKVAPK